MSRFGISFCLAFLLAAGVLSADEIVLEDGSRIVGTVRKLKGSRLHVKTGHMGTVRIQRGSIMELSTERALTVELDSGEMLTGTLSIADDLLTIEGDETWVVARIAVQGIDKAELTAWDRLDLDASGGLNLVRGNDRTTSLRVDGRVTYNYENDAQTRLKVSTTLNEQKDGPDTSRSTFDLSHEQRSLFGRFGIAGSARFETNEASQLDLRSMLSGTLGWRILKAPRNRLEILGGVSWITESFVGQESEESMRATFGFGYQLRFDRTRFDSLLIVIPSGKDRNLVHLDGKLRIELVKNLDFDVTFYDRYDSQPPVVTNEHDYGFTLGLGWTK